MKAWKAIFLVVIGFLLLWMGLMLLASFKFSYLDIKSILPQSILLIPEFIWYVLGVVLILVGFYTLRFGRKILNAPLRIDEFCDEKPFTLFLRPFDLDKDDELVEVDNAFSFAGLEVIKTIENQIFSVMKKFGNCISLSNPKTFYQTTGAKRIGVNDSEWQAVVINLLEKCHTVVITMGATNHMMWEINMTLSLKDKSQVLFVNSGYKEAIEDRIKFFKDFKSLLNEFSVNLLFDENEIAAIEDTALYGLDEENGLFPIRANFVPRFSEAMVNQEVRADTLYFLELTGRMKKSKAKQLFEWFVLLFFFLLTLGFFYLIYMALTL